MTAQEDPCLLCALPECDENDPRCAFYAPGKREIRRQLLTVPDIPRHNAPRIWLRLQQNADIDAANALQTELRLAYRRDLALLCIRWTALSDLAALQAFWTTQRITPEIPARHAHQLVLTIRQASDRTDLRTIEAAIQVDNYQPALTAALRWTSQSLASTPAALDEFTLEHTGQYIDCVPRVYRPIPPGTEPPLKVGRACSRK